MIAKFHSAPGHSMETTLTISLPPVQSVKTSRAEREREREREREWDREQAKEKEKREKKERKKEEQEREKELKELARLRESELETENMRQREREREHQMREQERARVHPERNVSYKDKFQRMREKYDKATALHESSQRELDTLNAKMKKLQAENELLVDAMLSTETNLYERYFPRSGSSSPLLGPSEDPSLPTPTSLSSHTPSQVPTPHPTQYNDVPPPPHSGSSVSLPGSMAPPISMASSESTGAPPPPSSAGLRTMPPPLSPMPLPASVSSNGAISSNSMPPPASTTSSNGNTTSGQRTVNNNNNEQRGVRYESPAPPTRRFRGWTGALARARAKAEAEAEEPTVNGDGPRTPTRTTTPMAVSAGETLRDGEEPVFDRSSRVNGNTASVISSPSTPNGIGISPRRQIEPSQETTPLGDAHSNHLRDDDDGMDNDEDDDEGPAPPGPDAGAGVHSPTDGEDEEEDGKMEVDEGEDEEETASPIDISPRRTWGMGSLRRGGRGRT